MAQTKRRKLCDRIASNGLPNPVDVHVGRRIRLRRTLLGLSMQALAGTMGVGWQQIAKYEVGTNRVSSSRLFDLGRALDVSIAYFFEEMTGEVGGQSPRQLHGKLPTAEIGNDPMSRRETLELVRAYYAIEDRAVRLKFTNMIRAIASER